MNSKELGSHQKTYDAVFQHPIAHNLQWRDVRSMLRAVAGPEEEGNGDVKFSRNGHTLVVHPPRKKDFSDVAEIMSIRAFLERSETPHADAPAGLHLLVVIDHREARVYRTELHGAIPARITPYEPTDFGRHLHYVQDDSNGQRRPENKSFYAAVAKTLKGADKILVFGNGTGASSAIPPLLAELKQNHPDLAERVLKTVVIDERHLTEDQILAKARDYYAEPAAQRASSSK